MGLGIPPRRIQIMLGSNPLKSRILVRKLTVCHGGACQVEVTSMEVPTGPDRVIGRLRMVYMFYVHSMDFKGLGFRV